MNPDLGSFKIMLIKSGYGFKKSNSLGMATYQAELTRQSQCTQNQCTLEQISNIQVKNPTTHLTKSVQTPIVIWGIPKHPVCIKKFKLFRHETKGSSFGQGKKMENTVDSTNMNNGIKKKKKKVSHFHFLLDQSRLRMPFCKQCLCTKKPKHQIFL